MCWPSAPVSPVNTASATQTLTPKPLQNLVLDTMGGDFAKRYRKVARGTETSMAGIAVPDLTKAY